MVDEVRLKLQKERYPEQQMINAYVVSTETESFESESQACVYQNEQCEQAVLQRTSYLQRLNYWSTA